jgi:hypothetical protein
MLWVAGVLSIAGCYPAFLNMFIIPHVFWAEPPSTIWVRVYHPELPVSFEMPENYAREVKDSVAQGLIPWTDQGDLPGNLVWGIRPVSKTTLT